MFGDMLSAVKVFNQIPFSKFTENDMKLFYGLIDQLLNYGGDQSSIEKIKEDSIKLIKIINEIKNRARELGIDLEKVRGLK